MDLIIRAIGLLFGGVIVGGLLYAIHKRDAVDWEQLAGVYGREWQTPRRYRRFANMILYSEGRPAKSYKGVISIGLCDTGVALRPNHFLVPFQPAIFIPYADIRGWDQDWYIDGKSTELSFRGAPRMRVIMPREQVDWMLSLAGGAARISEARPPHDSRPWLTYVSALVLGAASLAVIIAILVKGLPTTLPDLTRHSAAVQPGERPGT